MFLIFGVELSWFRAGAAFVSPMSSVELHCDTLLLFSCVVNKLSGGDLWLKLVVTNCK